ncbi:MAG TPA: hypothetical protein VMX75_06300 [Spirochaetia bacterium]|nr:hypothetical protein [Spirochaetia bacterium]
MVGMKRVVIGAALLILLPSCLLFAEIQTIVKLNGDATLLHEEDAEFSLLSFGRGRLDLRSVGNASVRGQLQIDTLLSDEIVLDIPRAFIRVRFPGFRITLGKTRVSWGEGFMFDAGDVLFDGMSLMANLSADEIKDPTDWMFVPYIPLGTFSYIEGVLLPHPTLSGASGQVPVSVDISRVDTGVRVVTKLLNHKIEAGYLYKGSAESHLPYVSFKGNLLSLDWHLSSSIAIPFNDPGREEIRDSWALSFGFFRSMSLPSQGSFAFRFESGIRPFGHWNEVSPSPEDSLYGLYLYPEISFAPSDAVTLFLRSIVSPIDGSALSFAGARWNIYQGFTMSFYLSVMVGDEDDHFGWNRRGDAALTSDMEYIYGSSR